MMIDALVLVSAYLVGSIPFGFLLVRTARGLDVRDYGSHNTGAINVFRVGGPLLGLVTLLLDTGKAIVAVLVSHILIPNAWIVALACFLVMLGHAYSVWFYMLERRFSEGKSVASGLGVLIGLASVGETPWQVAVIPVGVWLIGLIGPRLIAGRWSPISPATMAATISIPLAGWIFGVASTYMTLLGAMAALILVRHKNNILRLIAGTEPRLGQRTTASRTPEEVTAS
jgi:glycerol-3-phosphate acyltransferase PlsY